MRIGRTNKCGKLLDTDSIVEDRILGSWSNLTDDRRWIAALGCMILWLFEQFQMPIVQIDTLAIRCLWWAAVGRDQIPGQMENLPFKRIQLFSFRRVQFASFSALDLRVELGKALEERRRIQSFGRNDW